MHVSGTAESCIKKWEKWREEYYLFISFLYPWQVSSSSQIQSLLWSRREWYSGLLNLHSVAWTYPPCLHPAQVQSCCPGRMDDSLTTRQPHTLLVYLLLSSQAPHCNTLSHHWKTWDGYPSSYMSLLPLLYSPKSQNPKIQNHKDPLLSSENSSEAYDTHNPERDWQEAWENLGSEWIGL